MHVPHLDGIINAGDFIVTKINKIIEVKGFDRIGNGCYARGCVCCSTNLKRFYGCQSVIMSTYENVFSSSNDYGMKEVIRSSIISRVSIKNIKYVVCVFTCLMPIKDDTIYFRKEEHLLH